MEGLHFTAELLRDEGLTMYQLARACGRGDLDRVRRGAYSSVGPTDDRGRHLRLIAATLPQIGEDSVVSHASAAALYGLPVPAESWSRVWVTRPVGGNGRIGAVLHLRRCRLEADQVTVVNGIVVTSLERTACDLARGSSLEWGVIACDAALALGAQRQRMLEVVAGMRSWPGARRAERAVLFADPRAESPLESVSRLQIFRLGYPTPVLQFPVGLAGDTVATSDFGWEDERLVGECDGRVKYHQLLRPGESAADAVMREKRREERVRQAGYWIARWGWAEAWNPPALKAILDRAFAIAPRDARHAS